MKISDYGIQEVWTPKAIFFALFGIRIVRAISLGNSFHIAIEGVPPWRALTTQDLFNKKCYEIQ